MIRAAEPYRGWVNARTRLPLLTALLLLVLVPAAQAQTTTVPTVDDIVEGIATEGIYVAPGAEDQLSADEVAALRQEIATADVGAVYVAVLPQDVIAQTGNSEEALARAVVEAAQRPGVYAFVIGRRFIAGEAGPADQRVFDRSEVPAIRNEVLQANQGASVATLLSDFVSRLSAAEAGGGSSGGGGAGGFGFAGILALLGLGVGGVALAKRRKRRQQEAAQLEEVREVAEEDLTTLGNELYDLEPHLQLPSATGEARKDYENATNAFVSGRQALERAKRPQDLAQVSAILEEGRYAIACARARVEGRPLPEHRSPCFFNPAHGPSVTDVEWTPPTGATREVPVCQADAARVMAGEQPAAREINVGGDRRPYYEAPSYYGPWAGGYYGRYGGGGMFEGMLLGSILFGGPGFGMGWGGGFGGGYGDGGGGFDSGDFGGGGDFDMGDFGGGDFGDFGGGDF